MHIMYAKNSGLLQSMDIKASNSFPDKPITFSQAIYIAADDTSLDIHILGSGHYRPVGYAGGIGGITLDRPRRKHLRYEGEWYETDSNMIHLRVDKDRVRNHAGYFITPTGNRFTREELDTTQRFLENLIAGPTPSLDNILQE